MNATMPSKSSEGAPRKSRSRGSGVGKTLTASRSLPSLATNSILSSSTYSYALYSSPLEAPQPLCSVQVRKRCVERSAVHLGGTLRPLSQSRLSFTASERGLEWERSHVVSRVPGKKLPPLQEIMRMAKMEFNIHLPSKKRDRDRERERRAKMEQEEKPDISYTPYLGGPRLPMRGRVLDRGRAPLAPVRTEVTAPAEDVDQSSKEQVAEGGATTGTRPTCKKDPSREALARSPPCQPGEQAPEKPAVQQKQQKQFEEFVPEDLPFPWDDEEMRSAFTRFDTDRDNELHQEELPVMLRFLGARPQPGDVESIVKELTRYSTLSWDETLEFLRRFRQLDVQRLHSQFRAADKDNSGELDFDELYELLEKLGYHPTMQTAIEAMDVLDKNENSAIDFLEFEGLREHLRVTEGFTKADYAELVSLFNKSCLAKAGMQEVIEEVWRITMYLGYSANMAAIRQLCEQVNPDHAHGITASELLKIVRLVRETEIADMITTMKRYGSIPNRLPCEDLGLALTDLGYYVSEDAVNEILESLGECETEESLTLQEFGAFLRAYRRTEGFTEAELAELKETFMKESRVEMGALHMLEVGKVLRWLGFARTVQEVKRLVEEIDLDDSGVLEFTEFVKLMRRLHQEEAEKRMNIFNEVATPSGDGTLEVHVSALSEAVTLLVGAEPDPVVVENVTKSLEAELQGSSKGGGGGEGAETGARLVFLSKPCFEAWFRHFQRFVVSDIRASAGYSIAEKAWLQQLFNEYDEDGSGTIERQELLQLLASYFPDSTKSKEAQRDVQKALAEVDTNNVGVLGFQDFLLLTRKCDDARDIRDVQLEIEVVKECGFMQEEVEGFRQIFSTNVDWKGELDLATLANILSRIVELTEDDLRNLSNLVCDMHPQGREVARFPQFLKLVKRMTEENYVHLNDQAARFLRRQQQQQEMLQTARRLTQHVGSA